MNKSENSINLFESKLDNNTSTDYKLKKRFRYAECKSEKKKSSMKEHFEESRPHLREMIDDLKKSGEWKKHLTVKTKFI